jgi:hypothetical protein
MAIRKWLCSAFVFVLCIGWSNPGVTQTTTQTPEDPMAVGKQALQHGEYAMSLSTRDMARLGLLNEEAFQDVSGGLR